MMLYILFLPLKSDEKWALSDQKSRSLIKTVSWRVTGSSATFLISWIIADDFAMASAIALTQIVANTLLYYVHERVWNRIPWGTK